MMLRSARQSLQDEEANTRKSFQYIPLRRESTIRASSDSVLKEMTALFLASSSAKEVPVELLFAFLAHCILLETISVHERARDVTSLHSGLIMIMLKTFLPAIFFAMETTASSCNDFCDVDGRVYLTLVRFLTSNHTLPMEDLIGISVCERIHSLWSSFGLDPVDFGALAVRFPLSPPQKNDIIVPKPLRLLPFENDIFAKELAIIQVEAADDDDEVHDSAPKFNFGQGVLFSDTLHWHNNKVILPRHLGGEDTKPKNEWHRRKILKSEQRFMATLQRQAGTLTGALGLSLAQIVIPPVGSRPKKLKGKTHFASAVNTCESVCTSEQILGNVR
jgi:ATP-dependent RNA helicase DDX60